MNRGGPIIIIEDDLDDQEIFADVFKEIDVRNDVMFFANGQLALQFLNSTSVDPFIIISDISMPVLTGMELRTKIHENEDLRVKSIPYLFFSTHAEQDNIVEAYSKSVQGYFIKPKTRDEIYKTVKVIVDYWTKCVAPNNVR